MNKEAPSRRTQSLCFFNNKGGVGKTTLACNVTSFLAGLEHLRVLVVDADPQCNATQLILPEELTESIYRGNEEGEINTLRDVLSPLIVGEATVRDDFRVATRTTNRFGVDVLPGHPQVALLEDKLSTNWTEFIGGDIGGARVTNWNSQLLRKLRGRYDLVVYDVGPSLGALNRAVLVGVDYFVAPMGCDIFSLIGVDNIADWMTDWREVYGQALQQCRRNRSQVLQQFDYIKSDTENMCRFVGYTVQQYITKTIRKQR